MNIAHEAELTPARKHDIRNEILESEANQFDQKCGYAAPRICFQKEDKTWNIVQACCNHWDCPRCGHIRAREEYARMVEGAIALENDKRPMYFWTLTCRGSDLTLADAETGYATWTHRLLTSASTKARRAAEFWCYVQVTERQKRKHPHSHMICTYCPPDAWPYAKGDILPLGHRAKSDGLWSDWFVDANRKAGLGEQCQISAVRSAAAVATYLAKYMFEDAITTRWPPGWKRVRYSQNWPKLPELGNKTAFPVITFYDWQRVNDIREPVRADSVTTYVMAHNRGVVNVRPPKGWL